MIWILALYLVVGLIVAHWWYLVDSKDSDDADFTFLMIWLFWGVGAACLVLVAPFLLIQLYLNKVLKPRRK